MPVLPSGPVDATNLGAALQQYSKLSADAGSLLDDLAAQLAHLTSLTEPITGMMHEVESMNRCMNPWHVGMQACVCAQPVMEALSWATCS